MSDLIFDLIEQEKKRQTEGLELIASENYVSDDVMRAMGSVLTNKYAEGLPGKRYYGGCEIVDIIENETRNRLKELFNAEWVNVQPHSGAQANAAVMLACLNAGDSILGFDLSHGGHLTHGSPVNFSGKFYKAHFYGVNETSGRIDMNVVEEKAKATQPKLIICDESVSALDVSVQAQVLNLLNELKKVFNFSYIFISHDLAVVKYMSDQLIVMNQRKIEEINDADEIYRAPKSRYTKNLIAAIPKGI